MIYLLKWDFVNNLYLAKFFVTHFLSLEKTIRKTNWS